ncbi:ABC transporter substrate-binding protein [Spirochaetia bacterium]|nr:ABC transporter substrate-binding protein [Spirochaetia bacterium]
MKKAVFGLLAILLVAGTVFANGQQGGTSSGKIAVTFAGTEGPTAGQSRAMQEAADILNASGRFNVTVYTSGALSNDTDNMVTQARMGDNLVVPSDPGRLASQFSIPDLNILMAPYVLTDPAVLSKLPQTALYKEWQAKLEAQGIYLLADMFNGFRSFYTTSPVTNVAGLRGLRIRGFGNNIGTALAKYLGYAQTTMAATEIYSGIQAKSLDGCEIQAATADSYRLYEVTPYLALSKHYMLQTAFVCGKKLIDDMPATDREFFIKTLNDTVTKYSAIIAAEEQGIYDSFRARGMTVTEVSIPEFQNAVNGLYTNNDLGLSAGLKDRLFNELGL